jgi:hypothetical protein
MANILSDFFTKSPATTTQSGTSTTTANPWATAQPLLDKTTQGYMGLNTALTPEQQAAGQSLIGAAGGLPNMLPAATGAVQNNFANAGMIPDAYKTMQTNLGQIASGSTNPYETPGFADALSTMTGDITNRVKGMYAGAGRSPSGTGAGGQTLARGLMQGLAPTLQTAYQANVGNKMNANTMLQGGAINSSNAMGSGMLTNLQGAGMLTPLGMAPATAQFGAANAVQNQPVQNLAPVLSGAATLGGQGGTTTGVTNQTGTQTPANDPISNILGTAATVAGTFGKFSDRRLKTDIKDVGRTHDNQKIYSYRFKGSNVPQIGMMADEIEGKTPEAVEHEPTTGYKQVRYDLATRKAAKMGMLKAA